MKIHELGKEATRPPTSAPSVPKNPFGNPILQTIAFRRVSHTEVGRPEHRHANPIFTSATQGDMYVYRQKFWDVYQAVQGAVLVPLTLFSIPYGQQTQPIGGAAYQKTEWGTNLNLASFIRGGQPNKAYMMGIGWGSRSNINPTDAVHMYWDPLMTFLIDLHPYVMLTAEHLPYGHGPSSASSAFINNGFPINTNLYGTLGEMGETIEQAQSVGLKVDPTQVVNNDGTGTYTLATTANGGVGVDMKAFLDCYYYRTLGT